MNLQLAAHRAVFDAFRHGRDYPKICEKCDRFGRIHAHHFDYRFPLWVVFLCTACHGRIDSLMKKIGISPHRNEPIQPVKPASMQDRVRDSAAYARYRSLGRPGGKTYQGLGMGLIMASRMQAISGQELADD